MGGIAEWIGKAIPNEVSKLNSYSDYLSWIPYVGPFLSYGMKIGSALDSGFTAYDDTGKFDLAIDAGIGGIQGESQDPGRYGSGYMTTGQPSYNKDWANTAGQVGNYLPKFSKGSNGSTNYDLGGWQNPSEQISSIANNPYWSDSDGNTSVTTAQQSDTGAGRQSQNSMGGLGDMGAIMDVMTKMLQQQPAGQKQNPLLEVTSPIYGRYTLGEGELGTEDPLEEQPEEQILDEKGFPEDRYSYASIQIPEYRQPDYRQPIGSYNEVLSGYYGSR